MAVKRRTNPVKAKGWTVMIYMAAGIDDDQTEPAAIRDIKELESAGDLGPDVKVLVQVERVWPGYPQRYELVKGRSLELSVPGVRDLENMSTGARKPLQDFVSWGRNYGSPSAHYMLVLWGHAFGLGFGRDHGDPLKLPEMRMAIKSAGGVDLLGTNACAMSYAEAAYELRSAAQYLLAPEIAMPFQGWPYRDVLRAIVEKPDITPQALGIEIVNLFMKSFSNKNVALTLLDLGKAKELKPLLLGLARELRRVSRQKPLKDKLAAAFLDTAYGDVRPLIDLLDLSMNLEQLDDAPVSRSATALRKLLERQDKKFIVHHGRDPEFDSLHGLGIFAPAVTGAADLTRLEINEPAYNDLALTRATQSIWSDFVFARLKELLAPATEPVVSFIKTVGVGTRQDRTGVADLLVSVNRAFARLDETYTGVKGRITAIMSQPRFDPAARKPRATQTMGAVNGSGNHYLRLLPRRLYPDTSGWPMAQVNPEPVTIEAKTVNGTTGNGTDPLSGRRRDAVTIELRALEDALERMEKTTRRVVTNGRLGLGDTSFKIGGLGDDGQDPFKPGLGQDPFKPGLGQDPFKPGLGQDPFKPGLGLLAWLAVRSDAQAGMSTDEATLTQVFAQVARSLSELEGAVAKLETAVLMEGTYNPASTPDEREAAKEEVERAFREFEDAFASARDTQSAVLLHPTYGLGPGRDLGAHPAVRQQLAIAGGLGPRSLRLL